jgi:hypothetical protein
LLSENHDCRYSNIKQEIAARAQEAILAEEHDNWLQGLGVDVDKLREAASNIAPVGFSNPTIGDPQQQQAVTDTVVEFGKGFVKGVVDTAGGIVNSPGGQLASGMINPMAAQTQRAVDAAITGDPGKLAPAAPAISFDPNDKKAQQQAQAQVQSMGEQGLRLLGISDPIADAQAAATVLVTGDPNEVGQGAGRTFVIAGTALAVGGLAGGGAGTAAEAGATDAGAAAAGQDGAAAGAAESPAAQTVRLPQAPPGPISGFDPALDPAALGDDAPFSNPNAGPFGSDGPLSSPFTPRAPSAPISAPAPAPPSAPVPPGPDLPPPSSLPGLDEPLPPPSLPPGGPPGFPFGVD